FVFLQAEAGIRDFHVTGVQTCALPIWTNWTNPSCTVHILTAPTDPESQLQRSTVLVRIWMDDLPTGQADTKGLGERAARVAELFHHRPPPHERVWIRQCCV